MSPSEQFLIEVKEVFEKKNPILKIPINNYNGNFKKTLKDKLYEYETFIENKIMPLTTGKEIDFLGIKIEDILVNIKTLNSGIISVLDKYLNGKTHDAIQIFHHTLNSVKSDKMKLEDTIPKRNLFYRARPSSNEHFKKEQLFHIPFEMRTSVSTNRYSIPGVPALYLGDSSYTCWEEFDRPNFKKLYFSVFENEEDLNIVKILRLEDFLLSLEEYAPQSKPFQVLKFFMYFPITISSTIKVYDQKGSFKPEYLIPQMLLEYIVLDEEIDGIKFPSTKINYDNLKNLKSYNYVYPIKQSRDSGYCPELIRKFKLSEPSSLELEELMYYPTSADNQMGGRAQQSQDLISVISIVEGDKRLYYNTSFGKMDNILTNNNRKRETITVR